METYIHIYQINGRGGDANRTNLAAILEKAMRKDNNRKQFFKLSHKIINAMTIGPKSGKSNSAEERQLMWNTLINLKTWFEK